MSGRLEQMPCSARAGESGLKTESRQPCAEVEAQVHA